MVTLDLADEVVFSPAAESSIDVVDAIAWTGRRPSPDALGVPEDPTNLVLQALALAAVPAAVRLVKHIPPGAGLGGGSADAAAALRYAGVTDLAVAVRLGADVPFCLRGGRARVGGIGEELTPLAHLPRVFVVVTPSLVISTPRVYAAFDELGAGDRATCGAQNDLERAALAVEPLLAGFRALVAEETGVVPVLAGSGASYFVECEEERADELAARIRRRVLVDGLRALVSVARALPAIAVR